VKARLIDGLEMGMLLLDFRDRARRLTADACPGDKIVRRGLLTIDDSTAFLGNDRLQTLDFVSAVAKLTDKSNGLACELSDWKLRLLILRHDILVIWWCKPWLKTRPPFVLKIDCGMK